jgi:hypothetical protein
MDHDFADFVMIGVDTEQNITNLLPAIQWGIRRVCLLSSPKATKGRWAQGAIRVLQGRGVEVRQVSFTAADDSILNLERFLERQEIPAPRLWNLGGGLKSQQIALWRHFENSPGDWAVYTDPEGQTWFHEHRPSADGGPGEVVPHLPQPTDATGGSPPLSIQEVLGCFGYQLRPPKMTSQEALASASSPPIRAELDRFWAEQDYRRRWYVRFSDSKNDQTLTAETSVGALLERLTKGAPRAELLAGLQTVIEKSRRLRVPDRDFGFQILNQLFSAVSWKQALGTATQLPPLPSALGTPELRWPQYFEKVVQLRVAQRFSGGSTGKFSPELLFNAEVDREGSNVLQEHDVLLLQRDGRLCSLDAKTADRTDSKDLNSRLLVLERSSGRLASFTLVIPLFVADLGLAECRELVKLPAKLSQIRQRFVVIAEHPESFWLRYGNEGEPPTLVPPGTEGAVRCERLEDFLG